MIMVAREREGNRDGERYREIDRERRGGRERERSDVARPLQKGPAEMHATTV